MFSNSRVVHELDAGQMIGWKKEYNAETKPCRSYVDSHGVRRFHGTEHLKATEHLTSTMYIVNCIPYIYIYISNP